MSTTSPPPVNANDDEEDDTVIAQLQKVEEEINAQREVIESIESIVSARSDDPFPNPNDDDNEWKMKYQTAQLKFSEMRQQYDLSF